MAVEWMFFVFTTIDRPLVAQKEQLSGDLSIIGHSNSHRVDLNTNFPEASRSRNGIEAETQAVINWIKTHFFVLSASIRGGTESEKLNKLMVVVLMIKLNCRCF